MYSHLFFLNDAFIKKVHEKIPHISMPLILEFAVYYEVKKQFNIEDLDLDDANLPDYRTVVQMYNEHISQTTGLAQSDIYYSFIILQKCNDLFILLRNAHHLLESAISTLMTAGFTESIPAGNAGLLRQQVLSQIRDRAGSYILTAYDMISVRNSVSRNSFPVKQAISTIEETVFLKQLCTNLEQELKRNNPTFAARALWGVIRSGWERMQEIFNRDMLAPAVASNPAEIEEIPDNDDLGDLPAVLFKPNGKIDFDSLLTPAPEEPVVFHMDNDEHLAELASQEGFEYRKHIDDQNNKLDVVGIDLLSGGKGAVARERIKEGEIFTVYVGDELTEDEAKTNPKYQGQTHYFMRIGSSKTIIDARKTGNVARFFNEGNVTNAEYQIRRFVETTGTIGKEIVVTATRDINPGEQILVDYGKAYEYGEDIQKIFLHKSDGPYNSRQLLHKYREEYSDTLIQFDNRGEDEKANKPGQLHGLYFDELENSIVPVALADILANKPVVRSMQNPDLPVLFLKEDNQLQENRTTERLSSLMVASYLGHYEGVVALLKMNADPLMQSRRAGFSSLHMVMVGEYYGVSTGDSNSRRKIISEFKVDANLLLADDDEMTAFDWALKLDKSDCLEELIKGLTPAVLSSLLNHNDRAADKIARLIGENKLDHCRILFDEIAKRSHMHKPDIKTLLNHYSLFVQITQSSENARNPVLSPLELWKKIEAGEYTPPVNPNDKKRRRVSAPAKYSGELFFNEKKKKTERKASKKEESGKTKEKDVVLSPALFGESTLKVKTRKSKDVQEQTSLDCKK
ncbi:eukaryotic huntingtin interacting protein B [Legionella birminghamensis]|uniref:Eukaryotic huntingtin interacting protein B n=1 Tax=Legionella birminghamensis TaxID=28083 RepID=A0A378IA26_9GAMM|nr:SET domain-containing protein-lysine N-methyltransferase [Legionella birminghamensis]KTC75951.1 eukaryotic huntingtin interacting protein B [Legionella birminghamensis]STX32077.1 eukaryotic huntingtin interacting protein B [Legionella birminghamensis]